MANWTQIEMKQNSYHLSWCKCHGYLFRIPSDIMIKHSFIISLLKSANIIHLKDRLQVILSVNWGFFVSTMIVVKFFHRLKAMLWEEHLRCSCMLPIAWMWTKLGVNHSCTDAGLLKISKPYQWDILHCSYGEGKCMSNTEYDTVGRESKGLFSTTGEI